MVTQADVNNWLQDEISRVKALNIEVYTIMPNVQLRPFKRRFGQCRRLGSTYEVSLSTYFLNNSENDIRNTIAHEVLHACKNSLNHGESWKHYAEMFNRAYGYNIQRVGGGSPDKKLEHDMDKCYLIECQNCHAKIKRFRKSKVITNTNSYKCGACGGELKLVQTPK